MPYLTISLGFGISLITASCSSEAANVTVSVVTSTLLLLDSKITTEITVMKRRREAITLDL
ncbi:MAG: hypothetical protein KBS43_05945 [Oscillospiraceae bacterium]|nr:hypothetical protein [Candidatus Limimonas coprohippi]